MESNDSPEIPDRGETSDIPGLPPGDKKEHTLTLTHKPKKSKCSDDSYSSAELKKSC